jgi:hypothetical protein
MTTQPDRNAEAAHVLREINGDSRFRQLFPSRLAAVMKRCAEWGRYEARRREAQRLRLAAVGGGLHALIEADSESGVEREWAQSEPPLWTTAASDNRELCWVRVALWFDIQNGNRDGAPLLSDPPDNGLSRIEMAAFHGPLVVIREEIEASEAVSLLASAWVVRDDLAAIDTGLRTLHRACRAFINPADPHQLNAVRDAVKRLQEMGWVSLDELADVRELLAPLLLTVVGKPLDDKRSKADIAARAAKMVEEVSWLTANRGQVHNQESGHGAPANNVDQERDTSPAAPTMGDLVSAAGISNETFRRLRKKAGIVVQLKGGAARNRRYPAGEIDQLVATALAGNYLERARMAKAWACWGSRKQAADKP